MNSHRQQLLSSSKSKYFKFKNRLEKNIASGRFDEFSRKKKNKLVAQVEKFRKQLEGFALSKKGAAVAGSVVAGAMLPNMASAQQGLYFRETGPAVPFPATTNDFAIANIDSDPDMEVIALTPTGGTIINGNVIDGFTTDTPASLTDLRQEMWVGDIDGDNDQDIIFTTSSDGKYFNKATNDGDGNFTITSEFAARTNLNLAAQVVDWDSDGDLDIVSTYNQQYLQVLVNDGDGNFTDLGFNIDLMQPVVTDFEFADMDGDGDMDLVHNTYYQSIPYEGSIIALENTTNGPGTPTLDPASPNVARYIIYTRLDGISTFDMDGDGDLDIFFHRLNSPYSYAAEHTAETTPFTFSNVDVGYLSSAGIVSDAAVADFDNDGDDDLLVTGDNFTKLLRFDGTDLSSTGGDLLGEISTVGDYFTNLDVGDLDGDGHLDVLGVINGGIEYAYIDVSGVQQMTIALIDFSERKTAASADLGGLFAFDRNNVDIGTTDGGTVFSLVAGDGTNDADNDKFTIAGVADNARLQVGTTALDFETQSEYRIRINGLASGVNRAFDFVLRLGDSPEAGFATFEESGAAVTGVPMEDAAMADIDGDGDDELVYKTTEGNGTISLQTDLTAGPATAIAYGDLVILTDFDDDGDVDLVTNNGTDVYVYLNDGSGDFSDSYGNRLGSFGADVYDLGIADFNGDGYKDIVIAKSTGGELWTNDQDRTFSLATNLGISGTQVEVGDLDEDGRVDLVFQDGTYSYIHLNQTGTTFSYSGYRYAPAEVTDLVVADFDNDGNLDIFSAGGGSFNLSRGDGAGGFTATYSSGPNMRSGTEVQVGDLDGDFDLDLIFSAYIGRFDPDEVSILTLDGGYFHEGQSFGAIDNTSGSVVIGDVDGDDDLDFVLSGGESRQVFENDNIAPFVQGVSRSVIIDENTPVGTSLGQLQVVDENGDMVQSIEFHTGSNDNSIFNMDKDGNLTLVSELDWEELGSDLLLQVDVADDLGNSRTESIPFKINNLIEGGNGTFDEEQIKLFNSQTATIFQPGDYDMDGDADLFKATADVSSGGQSLSGARESNIPQPDSNRPNSIFQQNSGSFSDEALINLGTRADAVAFLDADNDGDLDLITHVAGETLAISINNGAGFNSPETFGSNINFVQEIIVGDFDQDGLPEIAAHFELNNSFNYYGVRVHELDPDDGWLMTQNMYMYDGGNVPGSLVSGNFSNMEIADFDGDDFVDLLIVTTGDDDVIFPGSGTGFSTTSTPAITDVDHGTSWGLVGDIDNDSDPDILIGRGTLAGDQMEIDVHLNDGTGVFTLNQTISNANQYFEDFHLGDVDGDGSLDLVTASFKYAGASTYDYNLEISTNDGSGYFALSQTVTNAYAEALKLMDVDGDDDLDIVIKKDTSGDDNNLLFALKNENVAPTAINLSSTSFDEHLGFEEVIATMTVDDLNPGDEHVISLVTGDGTNDEHNSFVSINGNELLITQDVSFEDTPTLNILLSVYDGYQTYEQAVVLTVNDVNQAPTDIMLSVTSFDEGTQPGLAIATISAVDANTGDTHLFDFATGDGTNDADNGAFVIDGDQLIIVVESNFETKASYNIYLSAEDEEGGVEAAFTITVNDVNQLPTAVALSTTSFDEGTPIGSEIATISAVDANSGDVHTFELTAGDGTNDADNGSFVVDGNKLIITTDSKFEDKATYNIYLSASDADGSVEEAIVLNVNDVNQAPTGISLSATSFDEGTAPGTSVATISAIDANTGDTHEFTFATGDGTNDADNGSFLIDGNNLIITDETQFETQSSYNILLEAADDQGSVQQAFTITINDVNQAPTGVSLSATAFDEGTAPGTSIATLTATDANAGDTHVFELAAGDGTNDADNASFVIDGDQLIITAESQFEMQPSYNIYVSAADGEGSVEQAFTITVNDVNQAPTGISLSATDFDEGTAPGSSIATLTATDANAGDTHVFELAAGDGTNDADNGSFLIDGNQLVITATSQFEMQASYNIYLSAADSEGSVEQAFTITVNDVNQAPTGITLSANSFEEGTAPGTTVADISAIDANAGDTHVFELATGDGVNDADNGSFVVSGNSLIITEETDFDVKASYNIYLSASDTEGSTEQAFVVTLTEAVDPNQAPTDIIISAISFDEGTDVGTVVATLSAADTDAGDSHTFELVTGDGTNDADNGSFLVNGNELIVTTTSKFETQPSYNIYLSTSDGSASFEKAFTIGVNDVNQAPTAISLSTTSIDEKLPVGSVIATIDVTDPNDGDEHTLTFAEGDGTNDQHNGEFLINGSQLILVGDINVDVTPSLNILIAASDGDESIEQAFTLTVNEVVGIEDEIANSLGVYPNPGGDRLEIQLDNDLKGSMEIKVSDLTGRVVHAYSSRKVAEKWTDSIDMTNAQPGIYLVEISFEDQRISQRWIKK